MMTSPSKLIFLILLLMPAAAVSAQVKKNPKPKPVAPVATTTPAPTPTAMPKPTPGKKNERPVDVKKTTVSKSYAPTYFYDFDRPGFTYSHIAIEHDANGKGQIALTKDGYDEIWTDPLQLTAATLEKLNVALAALDFINSTESYQYPTRDYSHMGNMTLKVVRNGKERTVKYNWTENKDAMALMEEYRRISNEYTWRFEIILARENQPLQTPGLMDAITAYVNRKEISDPPHLIPFLTELSSDERLPLMARNRATKLIKQIEKAKK
ncbi:MAG TPA: hypothetical protein PLL77_07045 [Pyrinomonadaceae bacterium]|nr:hypothetical protein [Pyrinomonadaceae bacterium]